MHILGLTPLLETPNAFLSYRNELQDRIRRECALQVHAYCQALLLNNTLLRESRLEMDSMRI